MILSLTKTLFSVLYCLHFTSHSYLDVLESAKDLFPEEQRKQVHLLQVSASNLLGITNDLLDYSRL